jgi:hypothetical protein
VIGINVYKAVSLPHHVMQAGEGGTDFIATGSHGILIINW